MFIENLDELIGVLLEDIFQEEKEKNIEPISTERGEKQACHCNCNKLSTIPVITKYRTFNNKVVIAWFDDGTQEKAICHKLDTFDEETGLTICLVKKMCGGSSAFNNTIRKAIKAHAKEEKEKIKVENPLKSNKNKILKSIPNNASEYDRQKAILELSTIGNSEK